MLLDLSLKSLMDLNTLFVTIVVLLVIEDFIALSFMLLKNQKKIKLELLRSCAKKAKLNLGENGMLLKQVFNAITSLTLCISGYHSSNPHLTSHETFTPNARSVWMRKSSYD